MSNVVQIGLFSLLKIVEKLWNGNLVDIISLTNVIYFIYEPLIFSYYQELQSVTGKFLLTKVIIEYRIWNIDNIII